MMIDIESLLDICDISYTEKQLLILEKLVDDLLQQHIKEAINAFFDDGKTSYLDEKLENEILGSVVEIDVSNIVAVNIDEVNSFEEDTLSFKQEISGEAKAEIKLEGLTHEVNELSDDSLEPKEEIIFPETEDTADNIKLEGLKHEVNERVIDKENFVEDTESRLYNSESVQKNGNERKMCTSCGMGFDDGITLREHLQTIHNIFSCKISEYGNACEHIFNEARTLCEHIQQAHEIYTCNICNQQLKLKEALEKHKITHHEYSCNSCGETLTSLEKYELHIKEIHDGEVSYHLCKVCDEQFTLYSDFESHVNTVHGKTRPKIKQDMNQCPECARIFLTKARLNSHLTYVHHDGKKDTQCDLCGSSYTSKRSLSRHKSYAHKEGKEVLCYICSNVFGTDLRLKQHIQSEHGSKEVLCHICSKIFGSDLILKKHIQLVHGSKDQKCQHCDKCFTNKIALTMHMKVHNKEFNCNICGILFAKKANFNIHMKRNHCDEKPFKCEECGNAYALKIDLDGHRKGSHDKTRPFKCEKCPKTFNVKKGLDYHIAKDHLSEKDGKICPYCEKPVKTLRYHKRSCKSRWPDGETPRIKCPNNCGKIIFITQLSQHKNICKLKVIKPVVIKTIDSVKCHFCEQIIRDYRQRKQHYIKKHFFCTICEEKLESRDKIIEHLTDQHDQKLRCEFCQYSTFLQSDVKTHVKRIHMK